MRGGVLPSVVLLGEVSSQTCVAEARGVQCAEMGLSLYFLSQLPPELLSNCLLTPKSAA